MNVIDIFCGCGGLSYGFAKEGFQLVRAFDHWDAALNVYNENFVHTAEKMDVYELKSDYLKKWNPQMIIGGPPCQDYSSAGKRDESLGRADLTRKYAELIGEVKPRWFVMENVDRITKSDMLKSATDIFREAGYGLSQVVLDASLCGVPQKRKRFFMIGELNSEDNFLTDDLICRQTKNHMTVFEYLGNEFGTEFYYRHPRTYQRRGIFSIYESSPTIRGVNRPIPPGYRGHKGDATHDLSLVRPLTTQERARIQTFPKSFRFFGTKADIEQMIGNAVPIELASYVAGILKRYITSRMEFCPVSLEKQVSFKSMDSIKEENEGA